ncbi:hypothetical protein BKA66DRAFT_418916 [Pyrenochaeta sp. MPI-SDFR-AT-0127]|nr:hypothetical protein BKA66DRAFT_418916 [Pyrenochaeta sp. MPI-SDFR-AT-0127]
MDIRPWLEETFEEQLLLANNWLQDQRRKKESGVRTTFDRTWEGLYHDNGSCLDTSNDIHPERNSALQLHPFTLTDGQCHVVAHLTTDCFGDVSERFPGQLLAVQSVIAVRRYTIRYTSYGPPRDKLRFILHKVDWLGLRPAHVAPLTPLHWNEQIGAVLKQLHFTRAHADHRCFALTTEEGTYEEAMAGAVDEDDAAPASQTNLQSQAPHTQVTYATQLAHPIRPRNGKDEPQFLGVNRMEPVLAGNTSREEIRPNAANSEYETRMKLLGLLGQAQKQHTGKPSESDSDDVSTTSVECSWMKGLIFDHDSLQVPPDQQRVLLKAESWYKPQAGVLPFQDGNIPIQLFRELGRLADEKAAAEGDSDVDSDMDIDPSPDSVLEDVDPSPDSILQVGEDGEPTVSQVSWSVSPSPEPPQRPAKSRQGLPPDSSFETNHPTTNHATKQEATIQQTQRHQPGSMVLLNKDEPNAPSSSPPVVELTSDSEDEMEMETSVPRGLGEDVVEEESPQDDETNQSSSASSPILESVVQVEQTPYAKSKHGQAVTLTDSAPKQKHGSSGDAQHPPSKSVVYGTYGEATTSGPTDEPNHRKSGANDIETIPEFERGGTVQRQRRGGSLHHMDNAHEQSVSVVDLPSMTDLSPRQGAKVNQTQKPITAQNPSTSLNSSVQISPIETLSPEHTRMESGLMKRKLADSPSKDKIRHSKRRELKIVGFGDNSRPTIDQTSALRQERAELLRKFREERNSSTSLDSRPSTASKLSMDKDADAMEVDSSVEQVGNTESRSMSPRHRSLYEDHTDKDVPTPHSKSSTIPSHMQPQAKLGPRAQQQAQVIVAVDQASSLTVFQRFKAAYPEYTGDTRHFQGQCTQMHKLDQEDKMVPKWQWDDFIIRNRTDYKDYALECVDRGENPEPYYRFYKDTIRDTLYKKGIIKNRDTLSKCLEELGLPPPVQQPSTQTQKPPRKKKSSRTSLPNAFNQNRNQLKGHSGGIQRGRPRHSLPASSQHGPETPNRALPSRKHHSPALPAANQKTSDFRSTSRSNLLQRLSTDQSASARSSTERESTGDPFRDYYFAVQRTTSWTGSTKVSSPGETEKSGGQN